MKGTQEFCVLYFCNTFINLRLLQNNKLKDEGLYRGWTKSLMLEMCQLGVNMALLFECIFFKCKF